MLHQCPDKIQDVLNKVDTCYINDTITVNTLIKECYTITSFKSGVMSEFYSTWFGSPYYVKCILIVKGLNEPITLWSLDKNSSLVICIVPERQSQLEWFLGWLSGSTQDQDANVQCLWFSKHWWTAGASFLRQLASNQPTNFPSK